VKSGTFLAGTLHIYTEGSQRFIKKIPFSTSLEAFSPFSDGTDFLSESASFKFKKRNDTLAVY